MDWGTYPLLVGVYISMCIILLVLVIFRVLLRNRMNRLYMYIERDLL